MTTFQMQPTPTTSDDDAITLGEIAYHAERLRIRLNEAVAKAFNDEASAGRTSRAKICKRVGMDPAQLSRALGGPNNMTLDTISKILLAMDAELDPVVVFFRDHEPGNYVHPLTLGAAPLTPRILDLGTSDPFTTTSSGAGDKEIQFIDA